MGNADKLRAYPKSTTGSHGDKEWGVGFRVSGRKKVSGLTPPSIVVLGLAWNFSHQVVESKTKMRLALRDMFFKAFKLSPLRQGAVKVSVSNFGFGVPKSRRLERECLS